MADYLAYQKSISNELLAIKDRVRNFIGDRHWGEDGRYKEIILTDLLRRSLPANVEVGTGFVIGDHYEEITSQIDIIIYKSNLPNLFKKEDFVIVPSSNVLGIIEVKTTLDNRTAKEAIIKATKNGAIIGNHIFNGIFGFGIPSPLSNKFRINTDISNELINSKGLVNHIAFGENIFMKFWPAYMLTDSNKNPHYAFYKIKDLSFGYFIANLIENIMNMDLDTDLPLTLKKYFYPIEESKEAYRLEKLEIEIV